VQKTIDDEQIIGIYKSRWSDSSATGQADLKIALKTLGHARSSRSILDTAADSEYSLPDMPCGQLIQAAVETYEQALAWIGADASQADDTIVALYGVKVS
jgi:ubiquitin carboxyl-terminal hydrolase 25/28